MLQVKLFAAIVAACASALNAARKVSAAIVAMLLSGEDDATEQALIAACEGYGGGAPYIKDEGTGKRRPAYRTKDGEDINDGLGAGPAAPMSVRMGAWSATQRQAILPPGFESNLRRLAAAGPDKIKDFGDRKVALNNRILKELAIPALKPTGAKNKPTAANEPAFKAPADLWVAWLPLVRHFAAHVAKLPDVNAGEQAKLSDLFNDAAAIIAARCKPSPLPQAPADDNSK